MATLSKPAGSGSEPRQDDSTHTGGSAGRIAKNARLLLAQQVLVTLATLVIAGLVARHLGRADYGLYEWAFTVAGMVGVVATFGMRAVAVRSIAEQRANEHNGTTGLVKKEVARLLGIRTALSVVVCGLAIAAAWVAIDDRRILVATVLALLTIPFDAVSTLFRDVFQGMERMDVEAVTLVSIRVFTLIGAGALVFAGAGVLAIIGVYALGAVVGVVVPVAMARRHQLLVPPSFERRGQRDLLAQGWPFFATGAAALAIWEVNPVMLAELSGLSMVGVWAAGTRFVGPLEMVPDSVGTALMPTVARLSAGTEGDAAVEPLLARVTFLLLVVGIPIGVGGALCARGLVELVFGAGYAEAARVLELTVAIVPLEYVTISMMYALGAMRRQHHVLAITVAAGVVNVAACIVLIPRYGAVGCGIAAVGVSALTMAATVGAVASRLSWAALFDRRHPHLRVVLATGAMVLAVRATRGLGVVPNIAVGALVYAGAAVGLRVVRVSDVRAMLAGRFEDDRVQTS